MIWVAIIFMIVSRMLWTLHDLYFWGKDSIIQFVKSIGWHNVKMVMAILFFESAFLFGILFHEKSILEIILLQFGVGLIAWGSFEMLYNILSKDANLFDWFKHINICIKNKYGFEYIFHHCFRLHWIEAIVVLCFGIYLVWRL